jgi:DNA-binding NarL/FixJ family response regulator
VYDVLAGAVECGELIESIRLLTLNKTAPSSARPARYRIEDRFSRYLDKLTSSERKVAMLAAAGGSNRGIARSLSLSISTVEQHLTHTYKKLGVSGRQQLRAKLG